MLLIETIAVALASLRANKLRSTLTMLGIIIGVSSVVAMIALGNGAQLAVRDTIDKLGTRLVQLEPDRARQSGVEVQGASKPLTFADAEAIATRAPHIADIMPQQVRNMTITFGNRNTNSLVFGVTSNFSRIRNFPLSVGRMFTAREDSSRARVAVVGTQVLEDLRVDDPQAIVGQFIRVQSVQFEVIGVLTHKGDMAGFNQDGRVLIPSMTARYRLFGTNQLTHAFMLATREEDIPDAMGEIETVLRRAHHIYPGQGNDFKLQLPTDYLTVASESAQVFTYLLAGIATVGLIVGGIGIMNIMLVSVTERTREIGIRKAMGATRVNILTQFLTEALVLCLLGGAIGVAGGIGASIGLQAYFGWNSAVDEAGVLLAFAFAAGIGLVFGVWPARRAAGLDPIEALRYE